MVSQILVYCATKVLFSYKGENNVIYKKMNGINVRHFKGNNVLSQIQASNLSDQIERGCMKRGT